MQEPPAYQLATPAGPKTSTVHLCYKQGLVRFSTSILLTLALVVTFAQAPFLHTHQHESTQRHAGTFLHFHLKSACAANRGPEFRDLDPNEDAHNETWFSATSPDSGSVAPAVLPEFASLSADGARGWTVEAPLQTGHDPPLVRLKSPRAPPV